MPGTRYFAYGMQGLAQLRPGYHELDAVRQLVPGLFGEVWGWVALVRVMPIDALPGYHPGLGGVCGRDGL